MQHQLLFVNPNKYICKFKYQLLLICNHKHTNFNSANISL